MDDVKRTYRDAEKDTKDAWRQSDGTESLSDKVGSAGDEIRKDLGNAGDDLAHGTADVTDSSKAAARRADGDSLADKVGDAGDEIRRTVTGRP